VLPPLLLVLSPLLELSPPLLDVKPSIGGVVHAGITTADVMTNPHKYAVLLIVHLHKL
jgi:hypothetical protein